MKKNYYFLSAQEIDEYYIKKTKSIPKNIKNQKKVLLSFDDGYIGIYRNLLPMLIELKAKYKKPIKVVLFVNYSFLGTTFDDLEYVDCFQLIEGFKKGFYDVQSHGHTHFDFTTLTKEEIEFQASQSQKSLKQCLQSVDPENIVANYIAYPYGKSNKEIEDIISKYYLGAFSYNNQLFDSNKQYNNYKIPRLWTENGKKINF